MPNKKISLGVRRALLCLLLTQLAMFARAGAIYIPNASFETPVVPEGYPAIPNLAAWEKSAQPDGYVPTQYWAWAYNMGTFYNDPTQSSFIDDCDGLQAAFMFADPDVAIFQDYDSIDDASTNASHAFNAQFNVGRSYKLTVGVIGGGGGMQPGATLQLSLYYRDTSSNQVIVAAATITNSTALFPTTTHLVDCQVQTPTVQPGDAWAGQHIGVQIASTVGSDLQGGYWDVDNVRLVEAGPMLSHPVFTGGQFGLTLQSDPGTHFEILGTSDLSLPLSSWTRLVILTNVIGTISFTNPAAGLNQRFYVAHQLP